MKIKHLLLTLGLGAIIGIIALMFINNEKSTYYVPGTVINKSGEGIAGAAKWYQRIRSNQVTGTVELEDVKTAQRQLKQLRKNNKSSLNLQWEELGPDNVGGRTRALLIDKDDPNLMFAGGVSGGLWKSLYGGSSWVQVNYSGDELSNNFTNLAVNSICQTSNGDIYFGTGEGIFYNHGVNVATPMIEGQGIWKSTDKGETWQRLESTWNSTEAQETFVIVPRLKAHPDDANTVYAATTKGIRVTIDGGSTWSNPLSSSFADYEGLATDIEIGSNGSIIASINDQGYIKRATDNDFIKISDASANNTDTTNKLPTDATRLEFDIAPSNPDYVYCGASHMWENTDLVPAEWQDGLYNIYKSTDGGLTWSIIGPGGSPDFQPYGKQGRFDNLIKVHPGSENVIVVGGLDLWIWEYGNTWQQISYWQFPEWHPLYLHADQHEILYHPEEENIMFVASDGGLAKLETNIGYTSLNRNYNVTQFFSVAFDGYSKVLGGTQDNGTQYIPYDGNTEMAAVHVLDGDGGQCAISQLNPDILFYTSQYGRLMRTNDYTSGPQYFYSQMQIIDHRWDASYIDVGTDPKQAVFVTPIALWETHYDENAYDTLELVCKRDYLIGETLVFLSENIFNLPIYKTLEKNYYVENENYDNKPDTIKVRDPYGSLFVLGLSRQLWITRLATNFHEPSNDYIARWGWWRMLPIDFLDYIPTHSENDEMVEHVAISNDGDHVFFSTSRNKLYRVSNIKLARNRNNADMQFVNESEVPPVTMDDKVIEVQQIHDFGSRTVTDIYCDQQSTNVVLITLGNYGNDEYVYYSTIAATTTATDGNFFSVQGNLPAMPVYSGMLHYNSSVMAIIGTEYGVFSCDNILEASPEWTEENAGMQTVPTFMIRQQTWPNWRWYSNNHGHIFIGTHGRGLWKSETLAGPVYVEENEGSLAKLVSNVKVYPNPVTENAILGFNVESTADITIAIYNIQGQLIKINKLENQSKGYQTCNLDATDLKPGSYIVNIYSGKAKTFAKFIKY